ncbi:histidine kinase [Paenibacillus sp. MER TA 81-3]|uniref:sensor histidine kinase n=1 Tax=Paenibacillus sp. MER TA 81-3 TaxID=2939573 RepID=UPI0020410602|nr:histidine kinase [Paenibacillus sp. MER TA 81-3]MCM3342591.1 histidine kinase [Paenibacillus sp. MER TA 81-3]
MNWLKRSLFSKLLIGMLLAAVVPFSLSNLIAYQTTSSSMKQQLIELNHNSMEIISNHLKLYFQELNMLSGSFYVDPQLMSYLRAEYTPPLQTLYINNKVNAMYISRPEFHAVRYISHLKKQAFTSSDVGNSELERLLQDDDHNMNAESTRYDVKKMGNKQVLLIQKNLIDYPKSTILGTLNMYIGQGEIDKLIHSQLSADDAYFLLIKNEQQLLYSSREDANGAVYIQTKLQGGRGSFEGEFNGKEGVFIYVRNQYKDFPFTLVKFVPAAVIYQSAHQTLNRSLLIQFIAIAFVILLAMVLSYFTILPVKRLIRNIARVENGRFDIQKGNKRTDELGLLEDRFYVMVRNLDDLMNREYRYRLELSTAQLKMLQAQINPHFLYNALQSIGTEALKHGAYEMSDKISELGAILRYSMDFQTEIVMLELELKHIEDYMSLQMGRFKNKLSYTLSCPPEARPMKVPKMLLQPLIENSIVHGIEKGSGFGFIHLDIECDTEDSAYMLRIRVIDNGKGITPDTMEAIRQKYAEDKLHYGQNGIGLINVLQRLRLCYGSDFIWEMSSVPYEATIISLYININQNEG